MRRTSRAGRNARTGLARWTALTVLFSGTLSLKVTEAGAAEAPTSTVTMVGEPNSRRADSSLVWIGGADEISVQGTTFGEMRVTAKQPGLRNIATFTFDTTPGKQLAPGVYEDAIHYESAERPMFSLSYPDDGQPLCVTSRGRFEMLDIAPDFSRLWLTYEHPCDNGTGATFGEIRYNMPADGPLILAPTRIAWPKKPAGVAGQPVPVTLVNSGTEPMTISGASVDGPAAADHAVTSNSCGTLAPAATCAMTVSQLALGVGARSATLRIEDSAGGHAVELVGPGVPPTPPDPRVIAAIGVPTSPVGSVQRTRSTSARP